MNMTREEFEKLLAELGAYKTNRPGVYRAPGREIVARDVGGGVVAVRIVACNC